jgi:hypothetical protein
VTRKVDNESNAVADLGPRYVARSSSQVHVNWPFHDEYGTRSVWQARLRCLPREVTGNIDDVRMDFLRGNDDTTGYSALICAGHVVGLCAHGRDGAGANTWFRDGLRELSLLSRAPSCLLAHARGPWRICP